MAWAMKCDRCGKYYEYQDHDIDGVTLLYYDRQTDRYSYEEEFDLCPECVKSYKEWFKNVHNTEHKDR